MACLHSIARPPFDSEVLQTEGLERTTASGKQKRQQGCWRYGKETE
jgi:hypothetical protein